MFGKTSTSYEIQIRRDGRWLIEAACPDEAAALSIARVQMAAGGVEAVKILKHRTLAGLSLETVVFSRTVPEVRNRPLGLGGTAEGAPFCRSAADLCGFDSRVVIGRLLRPFLDRFRITPTELLHSWLHLRKLDEQGSLLGAAVHAAARHHADLYGTSVPVRARELQGYVDSVMRRARDFQAERRRLPRFDPADLAGSSAAIERVVGPAEHDAVFLAQLALHMADCGSLAGKLEWLLDRFGQGLEPRLAALLDGVIADTLGSAELVKELLGPQPSLGVALCLLADHLYGREPDPTSAPAGPALIRVSGLVVRGLLPCSRAVLVECLRRALNGTQPLDRRDVGAEAFLVDRLAIHLKGGDGHLLGGEEVERALGRRLLRHRQTILRDQGMHDIADRLSGR